MLENLRQDTRRLRAIKRRGFPWYVVESLLFENGYQAVILYRIAHWFKRRRIPFFGPAFTRLSQFLTGVEIAPGAAIGPGLMISHGHGIVVGEGARIGARALLMHQVTIGAADVERLDRMPTIGDDVVIGAGARLIGGIRVGDRVLVGVNAVVTRDVPDDSKVVRESGQTVKRRPPRGPAS